MDMDALPFPDFDGYFGDLAASKLAGQFEGHLVRNIAWMLVGREASLHILRIQWRHDGLSLEDAGARFR